MPKAVNTSLFFIFLSNDFIRDVSLLGPELCWAPWGHNPKVAVQTNNSSFGFAHPSMKMNNPTEPDNWSLIRGGFSAISEPLGDPPGRLIA